MRDTSTGKKFRDELEAYIISWGEEIEILREKPVGWRFVDRARKLDLILRRGDKYLGIEAKCQSGPGGTADQKLIYSLEDAKSSPIPTLVVFTGPITADIKAKLITSGLGLEVEYLPENLPGQRIRDPHDLFRQRVCIELGLDWFKLFR